MSFSDARATSYSYWMLYTTLILLEIFLVTSEQFAASIAVALFPLIYICLKKISYNTLLVVLIGSVFFPIQFQVGGKDAFTSAQLLILYVYISYALKDIVQKNCAQPRPFNFSLNMLLFSGLVSTAGVLGTDLFGKSVRTFLYLLVSVMIFRLISRVNCNNVDDAVAFCNRILELLLAMACVQVIIGAAVYFVPSLGNYFTIFLPRNLDGLEFEYADNFFRFRSVIFNPENTGEFIAVISPMLFYLLLDRFKVRYLFYLLVLVVGLLLSVTRSGAALFFVSAFSSLLFYRIKLGTKALTAVGIVGLLASCILLFPDLSLPVFTRLTEAISTYETTGKLADSAGRGFVLESGWPFLLSHLSLFGNGMLSPPDFKANILQFHNLFMTIMFQNGLVGAAFYFCFFFMLLFGLLRKSLQPNNPNANLTRASCLSFVLFVMNEMKFEFNRIGSYYILIWILLALHYRILTLAPTADASIACACREV